VKLELLEAVMTDDVTKVQAALDAGAAVNARDSYGWSALSWAAGRGATKIVERLLDGGADVFNVGDDGRTPYLIAVGAGHVPMARLLADAEKAAGGDGKCISSQSHQLRPYCRAYPERAFQAFAGWKPRPSDAEPNGQAEQAARADADEILFLHRDLCVTRSAFHGERVVFSESSAIWAQFCTEALGFSPPNDFEWLPGVASE
jgi:uncharacterized protein